jgi:uncharacterized protein (TIGR01244 family)
MRLKRAIIRMIPVVILLTACQPTIDRMEPGAPVALDGWQGVRRIAKDGQIFFASQPERTVFRRLADEESVKLVINIRSLAEMARFPFDEQAIVEELGMEYVHIPCPPDGPDRAMVDRFAEELAGTTGPVLVHCLASLRVGALWMAYLSLHRGFDVETATEAGRAAGLHSDELMNIVLELIEDR